MTQMTIRNPDGLATVDYRELKPLQGNLKDLSKRNFGKLRNVLQRRGFTTPVFVWIDDDALVTTNIVVHIYVPAPV